MGAPKILDHDQLSDADVDKAVGGGILDPLPDNVLMFLRNMQSKIDDLTDRVEALEA
jgi:hypothetical protein